MQVIIMAAGLGVRLGALTESTPKALIRVAGKTLIERALIFAAQAGAERPIVVGGFCYADLLAHVAERDPGARAVENPDFRQGNLLSLQVGFRLLGAGGFLLMNCDHIYPRGVAQIVAETASSAGEVTAFCDFDRTLGADDMKVELDSARCVAAMSKQLPRWDAGYVGMTFVPACRRDAYAAAVAGTRLELGPPAHVEAVLVHLARQGVPPRIADISGHGWYEVDEPHERERAERGLAQAE